jgi:hypothetical protein
MAKDRFDGWLEIAAYLKIDPRTAQRYEKTRQLPVGRRPHGGPKSPVVAFKKDLDRWLGANPMTGTADAADAKAEQDVSAPVLARISMLANLPLYRKDYFLKFVVSRSPGGVRASLECRYKICNATNERQSFVQELTVDDPDNGQVEELSFLKDQKPAYILQRPAIFERCLGYSIYRGRIMSLDPVTLGITYECRAKWILNRKANDFWNTHMMLPTIGIAVETEAPPDMVITPSYASRGLVLAGEHLDVGWKSKR